MTTLADCTNAAKPLETSGNHVHENATLTVIQPRVGWQLVNFRELWCYRELLYFFTWRDIKIRYKQTLLGAAWALIQPFMMMVVFTIVLGGMAKMDSGDLPYPIFTYAGLLPWTLFSTALARAGNSVVGSNNIITKIYFPRLIIPLASVGASLVDFLIAFVLLGVLMLYYQIPPSPHIVLVPLLVLLLSMAALGVGTFLSALNVAYRDFKYTIPFLVQLWMFATPSIYMHLETNAPHSASAPSASDDAVPASTANSTGTDSETQFKSTIRHLLAFNPVTGIIAFFRAATLGGPLDWSQLGISTVITLCVFLFGMFYFRRVESSFADII